jgi:hypothetical protein
LHFSLSHSDLCSLRKATIRGVEFSFLLSKHLDAIPGCRYRAQAAVKFQVANLLNRALRSF